MSKKTTKQFGEVSLFVVIFSALLITVVVVSFIRIMVADQQQASNTDLSQSAYDSAQVGVEDAKRALLRYQNCIANPTATGCDTIVANIDSSTCNAAVDSLEGVSASGNEIKVQTNDTANSLDQAYTCVKINLKTDDYVGSLSQDSSEFIPLVGVSDFDTIKIEWFSAKDLQGVGFSVDVPSITNGTPLLNQANWTSSTVLNRPSVMRTQLVQFANSGFSLSDFDNNTAAGSNSTLFLYPTNSAVSSYSFSSDVRSTAKTIVNAYCDSSLASNNYACSVTLLLPQKITANDHSAYLNLTSIYKGANYRVTLLNVAAPVQFNAVQPEIDSTGRTNDLFRRVQSRVTLVNANFPYPEAAVDATGNLCKDFIVTDDSADYDAYVGSHACTP